MLGKMIVWLTVLMLSIPVGPFVDGKKESIDSFNYVQVQNDFDPKYTVIDFEDGEDLLEVADRYSNLGVTFDGADYLKREGHLNDPYPPHSGDFVIYNSVDLSGMVSISFDPEVAGLISEVGFFITSKDDLQVRVYNFAYQEVSRTIIDGPNYVGRGDPNYEYHFVSDNPIYSVTIDSIESKYGEEGYKNSFTIDDVYFLTGETCALDVPLYKQTDPEWKDNAYGAKGWVPPAGSSNTIEEWGCALTSAAMVISYHGLRQNGTSVTPQELNNWLRENRGYSEGQIIFSKTAVYAQDVMGIDLWLQKSRSADGTILRNYLCNQQPIILAVPTERGPEGHFVVATGVFEDTWIINDPLYDGKDGLLSDNYDNRYTSVRRFTETEQEADSLSILIQSPIEIVISDSDGVVTSSIEDAYVERIQSSLSSAYIESRWVDLENVKEGRYSVSLVGTDDGEYKVSFISTTTNGRVTVREDAGEIRKDQLKLIEFSYDHEAEEAISDLEVTDLPNLINLPVFLR